MIDPSKRDRLIEIYELTVTRDAYGGEVKSFTLFSKAWAQWTPMSARERFISAGLHNEREAKVIIPWLDGLTETMRLKYDDLDYEILGIAEIGRRDGLEITARVVK